MSVNLMNVEQAYQHIADLHEQATGQAVLAPVDEQGFISVAQATLRAGYDVVLGTLSQMCAETLVSVRPYNAKFDGLFIDRARWGAITRKINFVETEPEEAKAYSLVNGQSIDQFIVKKTPLFETHYYGREVYADTYTIFENQLEIAFSSSQSYSEFISGLMTHLSNMREQWMENLKRSIVANVAGACNAIGGDKVIHALSEYNTATGQSLTDVTVMQPANYPNFIRWLYARCNTVARLMSERSEKFQQRITGKPIMRHTPPEFLNAYILAEYKDQMDAMALSVTFNDDYLKLVPAEAVSFWQAIDSADEIQVIPAYVDANGDQATAAEQDLEKVIAVFMDRDAAGFTIYKDTIDASPYNAKGRYWNFHPYVECRSEFDATEKSVVILLD